MSPCFDFFVVFIFIGLKNKKKCFKKQSFFFLIFFGGVPFGSVQGTKGKTLGEWRGEYFQF